METRTLKKMLNSRKGQLKMMRSRKGQFFIFTAILLIAYSTLMVQANKAIPEPGQNFKKVYENFAYESDKAVNNAIFEEKDVEEEYSRFLEKFIAYAKMKKLQLEVFAIIAHKDNIHYINRMEVPVTVLTIQQTVEPGTETYFTRNITEADIKVPDDVFHENIYKFTFPEQETEIKAVLRVKKGSSSEIFVKE